MRLSLKLAWTSTVNTVLKLGLAAGFGLVGAHAQDEQPSFPPAPPVNQSSGLD